jgi:hypothetical protein
MTTNKLLKLRESLVEFADGFTDIATHDELLITVKMLGILRRHYEEAVLNQTIDKADYQGEDR